MQLRGIWAFVAFHTNPCKFRNFQNVVKYFLKHNGAKIFFFHNRKFELFTRTT